MTDEKPGGFALRDMLAMLYRRRLWLLAPTVAGLLLAIAVVALSHPLYRSQARLLITSQQIPTSLVPVTTTNYADERIARIRQQITSRARLTRLIDTYRLYPKERASLPPDRVIEIMRAAIDVDLVGATQGAVQAQGSTIAFGLSFSYRDPLIARTVAEQLTAMFLSADKFDRTEQATGTATFLGRRAAELGNQLVGLAGRRRAIEARYAGALPEQVAVSTQAGAALRAEVSRIDAETQGLAQQNGMLAAREQELAAAPGPGAETLRRAQERLAQLRSIYSDHHPDVVAARDLVVRAQAEQQADRTPVPGQGALAAEMASSRARIASLAARRGGLVAQLGGIERTMSLAPQATYELNNLERDYDNLKTQYQDIRDKQMEAEVAANLQSEDKGERFAVVDAPTLPAQPIGSSATQRLLLGALGGLAIACVLVLGWEIGVGTVHGEAGVAAVTGAPPLVTVPVLRSGADPHAGDRLRVAVTRLMRVVPRPRGIAA